MDPFLLFMPSADDIAPLAIGADEFARLPVVKNLESMSVVAVALSGGPDSMALCALVAEWAQGRGITVYAITVDHALRPESAAEARQVGEWVARYMPGVTHVILRRDPATISSAKLQELARADRYRLMSDYCHAQGIKHLCLAHHQDDQAETFLFRLCKGSGLDGLAAMQGRSMAHDVTLVRPFLGIAKERLVATCEARGLPFVSDPSNKHDKFARVRLRQIVDLLAREGLTAKRLAVTALRLSRAREALDHFAGLAWDRVLVSQTEADIVLDLTLLQSEPEDIRVRVIMRALTLVGGNDGYGPRLERVEDLVQTLFREPGFTRTTLHGCVIEKSTARHTLRFLRET